MTDEDKRAESEEGRSPGIEFHYIKSYQFRVIHCDGVIGSVTPRGYAHLAFYNERVAIPRLGLRRFGDDDTLQKEEYVEGRRGIVREIEVDVLLDKLTTRELRDWLNRRLEEFEDREQAVQEAKDNK